MVIRPVQEWRNPIVKGFGYTALFPFAALTFLVTRLRYGYYRYFRKRHSSEKPVIVVGSVFVGGSGKTPVTEWLALECRRRGFRVAVVSGGFMKRSGGVVVVSDGLRILTSAEEAGDEAMMMAMNFLQQSASIPVVSGKNRISALRLIDERFDVDLVILDDGLQYMKLRADIEIAAMDLERVRKCLLPLPWGSMRDSIIRLKSVNTLLISKISPGESSGSEITDRMKRYVRAETVLDSLYIPYYLKSWPDHHRVNEDEMHGRKVILFSGLASNEPFFRMAENMLKSKTATIIRRLGFSDHHWYTRADCRKIFNPYHAPSNLCWITTEKDAVRLKKEWIPEPVFGNIFMLICRTEITHSSSWVDGMMIRLFSQTHRGNLSMYTKTSS